MSKKMMAAVFLAKLQVNEITPILPNGASAMLCRAMTPRPVVLESSERNNIKPYFGNDGSVVTSVYSECELEVELAPSGSVGVAPKWAPLLQACAFAETITTGVSVVYSPITNGQQAISIDIFIDGIRHRMTNAKGTVSFELKAKSIPVLKFKFTGFNEAVVDATMPAGVNYSAFTDPLAVNYDNTPSWSLHGITGALDSVSFDMASKVVYRNIPGKQSVEITGRAPSGSITLEMDTIATKDWFNAVIKADLGTLSITHGKVAGKIVQVTNPKVQLLDPSYSDSDGTLMINMKTVFKPNLGNDELIITLT